MQATREEIPRIGMGIFGSQALCMEKEERERKRP
jgi:hypothetical protein